MKLKHTNVDSLKAISDIYSSLRMFVLWSIVTMYFHVCVTCTRMHVLHVLECVLHVLEYV